MGCLGLPWSLCGMFGIALMSLWDVWDYPDVVSSSSDKEAEVVHLVHALRAEESLKQQDYLICPFRKEVFFKATLQRMIKVISNQFPSCSMSGFRIYISMGSPGVWRRKSRSQDRKDKDSFHCEVLKVNCKLWLTAYQEKLIYTQSVLPKRW